MEPAFEHVSRRVFYFRISMPALAIEYRPILDAPGYQAGSDGTILSIARTIRKSDGRGGHYDCRIAARTLKPWLGGHGYWYVMLGKDGPKCTVHRLVCTAFHGSPPADHEVGHLDGNRLNNMPSNLAWVTHADNERHKQIHGTAPDYGTLRWGTRKVFKEDYVTLYLLHKHLGIPRVELARRNRVCRQTVDKAINTVSQVLREMHAVA